MSTLALVGLLVVLLVALGIAKVLLRGRRNSGRAGTDPSEPPRTVGELVSRREAARRAGLDADSDAETGPIPTAPPRTADDSRPRPIPRPVPAPVEASDVSEGSEVSEAGTEPVVAQGGAADPEPGAVPDVVPDDAVPDDVSDDVEDADEAEFPEDAAPLPNRPGSDADTGPASAPWSRGFVDGRQITPPAPAPRTPSPRESAPRESVSRGATGGSGAPVDPAGASVGAAGAAGSPAGSAGVPVDPAAEEAASVPAGVAVEPEEADASARPSAPPRQESRSPVDPDLVKRVTAVPAEGGNRPSGPDTEREYRQARDRMSGTTGVRSVPEQASRSPETDPSPVSESGAASGGAASGAAVAGAAVAGGAIAGGVVAAAVRRPSPRPVSDTRTDDVVAEEVAGGDAAPEAAAGSVDSADPVSESALADAAEPEDTAELADAAEPGDAVELEDATEPEGAVEPEDAAEPEHNGSAKSVDQVNEFQEATAEPETGENGGTGRVSLPEDGRAARFGSPSPFPPGTGIGVGAPQEPAADEPSPRPTPRVMRSTTPAPEPGEVDPADSRTDIAAPTDDPDVGTEPRVDGPSPRAVEPRSIEPIEPDAVPETTVPETAASEGAGTEGAGTEDLPDAGPRPGTRVVEPEPVVAFTGLAAARREPVPGSPAQDVEVRVADRNAGPLPRVAVSMRDGSGSPVGSATTGDDGAARLRAPGAGHYVLVTAADGFQTAVTPCAVADEPVRVGVTLTRSAGVHGVVRSAAGDARAGVRVTVEQDGEVLADADTGADGGFRFADLPAGYYRLVTDGVAEAVHLPAEADVEHDLCTDATAGPSGTRNRA